VVQARDVSLFFIGTLLSQIVTFASGVFVARWLGPEDYGVLSLVRSVYAVAIILAPLGLDLSLLRHLGENASRWPRSIAQVNSFRRKAAAINIFAAVLIGLFAAPWIEAHFYRHAHFALYLSMTVIALPFAADLAIVGAALRGMDKPVIQNMVGLYFQPLLRLAILMLFLVLGLGVAGVVLSTAIAVAASAVVLGVAFWSLVKKRNLQHHKLDAQDREAMNRVFGYSGWLAIMLFCYNVLRSMDILVLGWYRPVKEVGEYAALSNIAFIIQIFPQAVSQTLGPTVARRYAEGDLAGVRHELSQYLRRAVLLSSPIFATIAIFGPWLDLLFGARYQFSPALSFSMALAYMISSALGQMGVSLTMTGRHRLEFCVIVVGGLMTFGACVFTAPRYGAVGVALSVAAGYALLNGVRTVLSARFMGGLDISFSHLVPPLVCLALAAGWRWALDLTLPHSLLVGVFAIPPLLAAYGGAYWVWILNSGEKAMLGNQLAKRFGRRVAPA
jgi:O-antigen/teichoic acid export membrane protein